MISKKSIIGLGITFLLLFPTTLFAQDINTSLFPTNTGLVTDSANILTESTKSTLNEKLNTLKETKQVELAVVTVTTLSDYPIEDYTLQLGRHWGVGQKDTDSGVVFLIAPNEREVRIEVGYGIEGTLTDAQSFQIINQVLPYFKEGDYSNGILFGTDQIITTITTGYLPETTQSNTNFDTVFNLIIFGFFGLIWLAGILGRSKNIWAGAVIGGIGGVALGIYLNLFFYLLIGGTLFGLLFDYLVSKNYNSSKKTPWWAGGKDNWWDGPRSGGGSGWSSGGGGGFGGGSFGGGGSSGRW